MGWIHSGGVWSILLYIEGGGAQWREGSLLHGGINKIGLHMGELTPPPRPTHTLTHTCTSLNCTETETIFMFEGF